LADLLRYELDAESAVATITLDDGKVNAQSPAMLGELGEAFDRAESEAKAVILTGRAEVFSGGFDLKVFQERPEELPAMIGGGAELDRRLLGFPKPVVAAVNGNAIAAGAFLCLACDVRIGVSGPFRFVLNEVAIGMVVPKAFVELARHRMTPPEFDRALGTAHTYSPEEAVGAGFLDCVVEPGDLEEAARSAAAELAALNLDAHAAMKLSMRSRVIDAMDAAIDSELRPPAG
jgi:enoyl-CoA hydratase